MHHTRKNRSSKKNKSRGLKHKSMGLKKNKSKGLKHIKRSIKTRKVRGGLFREAFAAAKNVATLVAQKVNPLEKRKSLEENEQIAIEFIKMFEAYDESSKDADGYLSILLKKYDALAVSSLKCKDDKCRAAKKKC